MTQNDEKIHFSYRVEILSLKSYFSTFLLIYSTFKQRRVFFNYIRMVISTLFVEKVEIATILIHNLILGGYLHQICRYFHLMKKVFIRVE